MANEKFPGNPYAAGVVRDVSSDSVAVAKAIQLLAFEVRTANIQRQAAVVASGPDWSNASEDAYLLWEGMQRDIGTRLGVPDL